MSKNLPLKPAVPETISIAPENLEVANTYLKTQSIQDTADYLGIPREQVSQIISKREVRQYVDSVFLDVGYRNKFKLGSTLDKIIDKKLQELEDADLSSQKDIADLLALAHKMRMDELAAEIKLIEARAKHDNIKNQVNVQINETLPGGNYGDLLEKLLSK